MTNDTSKQNVGTPHNHEQEMTEDLPLDTQLKEAEESFEQLVKGVRAMLRYA